MVEPNISLITNVAPSHLEGLSDLAGVAEEKLDLFRTTAARRDDIRQRRRPVACGVQEAGLHRLHLRHKRGRQTSRLRVSADRGLDGCGIVLDLRGERVESSTRLIGRHNFYNVLAAASLASFMGVPADALAAGDRGVRAVQGPVQAGEIGRRLRRRR